LSHRRAAAQPALLRAVLSCENVSNWTFRFGSKFKAPKHVFLGGEVVATMSYDNDLRTILEAL